MGMTIDEAKNKMDFLKKAYQKLIDEKVDSGKLIGDGVSGEWKAETPLDEAYKDIIEALGLAIKALEQQPKIGYWKIKDGKEQGYDIAGIKTWYIQIVCSECGWIKTAIEGLTRQYHYCPNCGAKMTAENKR